MSKPTKENIATVINGLKEFYAHLVETQGPEPQNFDPQEFMNFMEPKFEAAGYRDKTNYNISDNLMAGNILILTEVGVGDFIVATSAIRETRRLYPNAHITLLAHSRTKEFAETCPYVNEIVVLPQRSIKRILSKTYKENLKVARKLLEQRFDICFSFSIHAQMPLLMYMGGAKIRVTTIFQLNFTNFNKNKNLRENAMRLATHLFPYNTYGYHMVDKFLANIENFFQLKIINREMEIWYTPDDVEVVKAHLRGVKGSIYSLSMGGNFVINLYPPEKYARLVELIIQEEPTATVVILGAGEKDLESAEIFKNTVPAIYANNVIDLTNKITYRQSGAVLSFCKTHIVNDTGTLHLAAAVNCPVLEPIPFHADEPIYDNDCPRRWHPYCVPSVVVQPAYALPECRGHSYRGCKAKVPHCITQIEPETLFKGFQLLKERIAADIREPIYIH